MYELVCVFCLLEEYVHAHYGACLKRSRAQGGSRPCDEPPGCCDGRGDDKCHRRVLLALVLVLVPVRVLVRVLLVLVLVLCPGR